jgi:hypothetical protein
MLQGNKVVDAFVSVETFDHHQSAGIRLVAKRLDVHFKRQQQDWSKKLSSNEVSRWVVERMVSLHDQYEEDWIISCFLILACNSLLFPTTSSFLARTILITESLEEVKNYDWCQRLCDDIVAKSEKFMLERASHVATILFLW